MMVQRILLCTILITFCCHSYGLTQNFKNRFKSHLGELRFINESDDFFVKALKGKVNISLERKNPGFFISDTMTISIKAKRGTFGILYNCEVYKDDLDLERQCGVWKLNDCSYIASPANRAAYQDFKSHFGNVRNLTRSSKYFYLISNRSKLNSCKRSTTPASVNSTSRYSNWKDGLPPGMTRVKKKPSPRVRPE